MQDGEFVTFSEVDGMPELNRGKPFKVINCKVAALPKFCSVHVFMLNLLPCLNCYCWDLCGFQWLLANA